MWLYWFSISNNNMARLDPIIENIGEISSSLKKHKCGNGEYIHSIYWYLNPFVKLWINHPSSLR